MAKATDTTRVGYKESRPELRRGENRALYVLYGEESFLIDKLISSIRGLILAPGAEPFDSVAFSGTTASRLSLDRLKSGIDDTTLPVPLEINCGPRQRLFFNR